MKIELKNIKYFAAGSEETSCFVATIYVNGKNAGEARNEGHGGPTSFHPWELQKTIDEYAATLPKKTADMGKDEPFEYAQDAESICDDLLNAYLIEKDLKKLLAKRMIYTKNGEKGIRQTNVLKADQLTKLLASPEYRTKWNIDQILNNLPFEEALAIYSKS